MGFKLSKKKFTEKQESTKTCKINTNTNKNTHSTVTKTTFSATAMTVSVTGYWHSELRYRQVTLAGTKI